MRAADVADRIVEVLLRGSGPILLVVPGTLGGHFETSMLATARAFVRQAHGPVSISSIPYSNGVLDCVTRYFGLDTALEDNVLAHVIRRLRAAAPHRPILLAGESQGAWMIADTLRQDPTLGAAVTRIALMAKPGFVQLPASIGSARLGAAMLPGTGAGTPGILTFGHTDDIVPNLFGGLGLRVLDGYVNSLLAGRGFEYPPHHYDWHGEEAARWLLDAVAPDAATVHGSWTHPPHREPTRLR